MTKQKCTAIEEKKQWLSYCGCKMSSFFLVIRTILLIWKYWVTRLWSKALRCCAYEVSYKWNFRFYCVPLFIYILPLHWRYSPMDPFHETFPRPHFWFPKRVFFRPNPQPGGLGPIFITPGTGWPTCAPRHWLPILVTPYDMHGQYYLIVFRKCVLLYPIIIILLLISRSMDLGR